MGRFSRKAGTAGGLADGPRCVIYGPRWYGWYALVVVGRAFRVRRCRLWPPLRCGVDVSYRRCEVFHNQSVLHYEDNVKTHLAF